MPHHLPRGAFTSWQQEISQLAQFQLCTCCHWLTYLSWKLNVEWTPAMARPRNKENSQLGEQQVQRAWDGMNLCSRIWRRLFRAKSMSGERDTCELCEYYQALGASRGTRSNSFWSVKHMSFILNPIRLGNILKEGGWGRASWGLIEPSLPPYSYASQILG